MAILVSKLSGQNDEAYKVIDTTLSAVMRDIDNEKNKDDELVKALYNVKKSDKFAEKAGSVTEFGDFEIVGEGDKDVMDDIQSGFSKLIQHLPFSKGYSITAEMIEDSLYEDMKDIAAQYIRAYKRSRAKFASNALISEGATFLWGSKSIDKTTGDGVGLFNTAHPGKKSGVSTQSNVFTNAFGTDSSMLIRLANIGRNYQNQSGNEMGYEYDTIVIPSNVPTLEDTIKKIIRSDGLIGSPNNDVNTQKGLWKLVVDHRWSVASGAPFIVMSSEANADLQGSVFYDRLGLKINSQVDLHTQNLEYNGRCRMSAGFRTWTPFILGGASAGTTLS